MMTVTAKRVIGVMSALMLMCAVFYGSPGAASAATEANHSYTKDGWTVSWESSDFSDLSVAETADQPDSDSRSADAEVGKELISTWRKMERRYSSDRSGDNHSGLDVEKVPDGCTGVPNSYGEANFKSACDKHDECYGSSTDRKDCDTHLKKNLEAACKAAYIPPSPADDEEGEKCMGQASVYYAGVRKFGKSHYAGSGNPA